MHVYMCVHTHWKIFSSHLYMSQNTFVNPFVYIQSIEIICKLHNCILHDFRNFWIDTVWWDVSNVCFDTMVTLFLDLQADWELCARPDCQHVPSDVASSSIWWECGLDRLQDQLQRSTDLSADILSQCLYPCLCATVLSRTALCSFSCLSFCLPVCNSTFYLLP